jgi:hypothetical protein
MKKCNWCGREYADETAVCAIDQAVLGPALPASLEANSQTEINSADSRETLIQAEKDLKRLLLAGTLALVHTGFFILIAVAVSLSSDPEASMAYCLFLPADYPISRLYQLQTFASPLILVPVLGGLLWFCYGFVLQSVLSVRGIADLPRLAIGILLLGLVFLIPGC